MNLLFYKVVSSLVAYMGESAAAAEASSPGPTGAWNVSNGNVFLSCRGGHYGDCL